jgi:hypothetical protein
VANGKLRDYLGDFQWPQAGRETVAWVRSNATLLLVVALFVPAAHAYVAPLSMSLAPGAVDQPADEDTYVSIQGFHHEGQANEKKPARLVAVHGNATVRWRFDGEAVGAFWFYDVDPLADGGLLVTTTHPDGTRVLALDSDTREVRWRERFAIRDTHDVARMPAGRLLVPTMRANDDGVSDDRLFVYDRATESVDWTWRFRDHYPNDTDGGFDEDWTHVNDVDVIDDAGRYVLTSPRNFDQVIVVDRRTDEVDMALGADGRHGVLHEQHNPDYLERADGTPVILVADSENDRVVEYERDCGGADPRLGAGTPPSACAWERVWVVDGFNWPRDADRLPNGNTLVTDTLNHRVVEVTPSGEVVWEFHAPWGPYEAERGERGSHGPTMGEVGADGSYTVHGGNDRGPVARYSVSDALADAGGIVPPLAGVTGWVSTRYAHVEPWIRPVWMSSWAALSTALGVALLAGVALTRVIARGRRIVAAVRSVSGSRFE